MIEKNYGWKLVKITDGDTIKFEIPDNPYMPRALRFISIRLLELDTGEITRRANCQQEIDWAKKAKTFLESLIDKAQSLEIEDLKWGKYGGRCLGKVYITIDNKRYNISQLMVENQCGIFYDGKKKNKTYWCENHHKIDEYCTTQ